MGGERGPVSSLYLPLDRTSECRILRFGCGTRLRDLLHRLEQVAARIGKRVFARGIQSAAISQQQPGIERPLLKDEEQFQALYSQRQEHYSSANFTVDTYQRTIKQVVDEIERYLKESE